MTTITISKIAKEFGISEDRIRRISKDGKLTRDYYEDNERNFSIKKDSKYLNQKELYAAKNKIKELNNAE